MPWSLKEFSAKQEYPAGLNLTDDVIKKIREVDQQASTLTNTGISGFSARVLDTSDEKTDLHARNEPAIIQLVEIIKKPGQSLGLYLREGNGFDRISGVFASRFGENSELERYGAVIRPGDEILSINNVEVSTMSIDDVVLILSIPRRLLLRIRYLKHRREKPGLSSTLRQSRPVVVFQKSTYDKSVELSTGSGGVLNQLTTTANTWLGKRARQQSQQLQQRSQFAPSNSKTFHDQDLLRCTERDQLSSICSFDNAFSTMRINNTTVGTSDSRQSSSKIRRAESFSSTMPINRNGLLYKGYSMPRSLTSATSPYSMSHSKTDGRCHRSIGSGDQPYYVDSNATSSHQMDAISQQHSGLRSNSLPRRRAAHGAVGRTVKWRNDVVGGQNNNRNCGGESDGAYSAPEALTSSKRTDRRTVNDIFSAQEYRNWAGTSQYMDNISSSLDERQSRHPLRCRGHPGSSELRSSSLPPRVALSTISQLGLCSYQNAACEPQSAIVSYRRPTASKMLDRLHVSPLINRRTPLRSAGPGFDVDKFRDNSLTGLLTVHIIAGRGLKIPDKQKGQTNEMYCVLEINEVHRARTGVSTPDRNYRWGETFDIDVYEATQAQFFVYSWHPRFRHQLCHKGMLRLAEVFLIGEKHEEWNFSLNLEPKGQLIIRIGFKSSEEVFRRSDLNRHGTIFGSALSRIMEHDASHTPIVLRRLVQEIEDRGVDSTGLYILCGSVEKKKVLRNELDALYNGARSVDLGVNAIADTNVLACVLKDFLRELPEPLVPPSIYRMMAEAAAVIIPTDTDGNRKLFLKIVDCLPSPNKHTLLLIMDHLKTVLCSEPYNGITVGRLATVFAPLVFCSSGHVDAQSTRAAQSFRITKKIDKVDVSQAIPVFQLLLELWPSRITVTATAQTRLPVPVRHPHPLQYRNLCVD
ncbi:hypothetical protein QR680_000005 [Steinernema hermaphroditum]|uniref:Rho-GAP domain-containing protein n=1 Tax=Steinernema hermaphroditum TaxID=289476 RepID=A0AA39GTR4_9BILA|nr:hypothetical protein QR680_000005 [Steinernema hermaphroditum]